MSYTTVKALWPGEKHEDLEELRNSHGSAPVIWDLMCQEYLGTKEFGYDRVIDDLWPLWKRCDIPEYRRAVLMMTYDRVYVIKADYERAAKDIRAFLKDYPPKPERVNHWTRIAEIYESNPDIPAIGLYCTSVSEDPFAGTWDEEKDEEGPTDWEECYDMYAEIDKVECITCDLTGWHTKPKRRK